LEEHEAREREEKRLRKLQQQEEEKQRKLQEHKLYLEQTASVPQEVCGSFSSDCMNCCGKNW
jgi:hypothetical protein